MPVGPPVADAEHEIGGQQGRVAVAMRRLQPDHPGDQRVVVRDRAPAHQRRYDGHAGELGELDQQIGRVRVDDPATGDDQRPLGSGEQRRAPSRPAPGSRPGATPAAARTCRCRTRSRPAARPSAGRSAPDPDGPRASAGTPSGRCPAPEPASITVTAHFATGLAIEEMSTAWKSSLCSLATGAWPVMHRIGIESADAEYRPVIMSVPAGSRRTDADADVAGSRPGVALGHVRGALDVPGQHVLDPAVLLHRAVEGVDRGAGQPERLRGTFLLQDQDRGVDRAHPGHQSTAFSRPQALHATQQRGVVETAVAVRARGGDQLGHQRSRAVRRRPPRARPR